MGRPVPQGGKREVYRFEEEAEVKEVARGLQKRIEKYALAEHVVRLLGFRFEQEGVCCGGGRLEVATENIVLLGQLKKVRGHHILRQAAIGYQEIMGAEKIYF
jgi:hypothetical protein